MKEKPSNDPVLVQERVMRASMEGNVYMPQNGAAIAIHTAENCLAQECPSVAMRQLVAPIPVDDALERRTIKANAQHKLHNIGRELSVTDVRYILAAGNVSTINLLASTLEIETQNPISMSEIRFEEDGSWATEKIIDRINEIELKLTPDVIEVLRSLFLIVRETLESSEVKQMLAERKELFDGWKDMDDSEQRTSRKQVNLISHQVIGMIKDRLFLEFQDSDRDVKSIIMSLEPAIERFAPQF